MKTRILSSDCYKYFSDKEGNQHIAGLFALEKILDIIKFNNPNRILEVGLGIGSIAYTIMKYVENDDLDLIYHGTEANQYCIGQLKNNLSDYFKKIEIFENLQTIEIKDKYDFVIIDGSDESLDKVKNLISTHGIIFIEGGRMVQTKKMNSLFPNHKHTVCISDFKNPKFGPFSSDIWSGGGQLIYVNPNNRQLLHFVFERVKTSFKYKVKRKMYPRKIKHKFP